MEKKDMRKEIAEAVTAADRALQSLEEAGMYLSKAAGWGVWDLLGGGMFGTFMKHSRMDDASRAMEAAKSHLRRLKRELLDVELPGESSWMWGTSLHLRTTFLTASLLTGWCRPGLRMLRHRWRRRSSV